MRNCSHHSCTVTCKYSGEIGRSVSKLAVTDGLPLSPVLEDRRPVARLGSLTALTGGTCPGRLCRSWGRSPHGSDNRAHGTKQSLPAYPAAACQSWLLPALEERVKAEKAARDGAAQLQRSQKGLVLKHRSVKTFKLFLFFWDIKTPKLERHPWQMKWLHRAPTGPGQLQPRAWGANPGSPEPERPAWEADAAREMALSRWAVSRCRQHTCHQQAGHRARQSTYFNPGMSRRLVSPVQLISKSCF